jgi:hypothetical protein
MKRKIEIFLLLIILVGAFVVRLYGINNPLGDWHSWRQADTASVTQIYADHGIDFLYPKYYDVSNLQTGFTNIEGLRYVEFPIYNVATLIGYKIVPRFSLEVWGRLVSIFCAIGTSFFIYKLGKKYMGTAVGLASAFFYAFIPFNIYFTRVILPEPMAVLFAISSLWFFAKYTEKSSKVWLLISAILFAAGMLLKPYIIFYSVGFIYLFIKSFGFKGLIKKVELFVALDIALIPFFLWRIWMNQRPYGIPAFDWAFNGDGIRFRPAFWRWIIGERLGNLILGIWGTVPFVFGILKKNSGFLRVLLLGMFLYVSVVATASVRHDYYQTLIIPAVAFALGVGSIYMWRSDEFGKVTPKFVLLACLGMMFGMGAFQIKEDYKINHPEIMLAGAAVDRIAPKDAMVVAPYNGDTAFLYQTKRFGWPFVERPVDELIKVGADYFVSVNFDKDTEDAMAKYKTIEKTKDYVVVDLHQRK